MGRTFQHSSLFDGLTARENVAIAVQRKLGHARNAVLPATRFRDVEARSRGAARAGRPRRPRRRRRRLAVVRPPPPARDRPRARHGAAPPASRRADGGDVARRGAAVHGPDRRAAGGAHADDRRARHGRRLRARDGDLGARRGPADRERPAGGDPRRRPPSRRRTSAPATGWRSCSPHDRAARDPAASAPATTAGDVLQGVDLDLHEGEVVALLGRNGVGKTTLMNTIIGLVRPRAGSIKLDGPRARGPGAARDRARGDRDRPAGAADLRPADRRGEPEARPPRIGRPPGRVDARRRLRAASARCGSGGGTAATSSRAASSRWSRSAARCSRTHACSSSTSRPRGSRRSSST